MPRAHVGRLRSSADWARELSRLYRQMRRGEVPLHAGTKLAFVGRIAALQTKLAEELALYRKQLTEWLRVHGDAPPPALSDPFESQTAGDDADFLPDAPALTTSNGLDAVATQE